MMGQTTETPQQRQRRFDLLRAPLFGPILMRPVGRRMLQILVLLISIAMVFDGFTGSQLAPRNLATIGSWVHFRGLLILVLLVGGNFFCTACPFMFVRDLARRIFRPVLNWPLALRNKWLSIVLLVAFLFVYEWLDLWGSPVWTAWLIVGYFGTAIVVDSLFKHASFCKYVCPIGQFNFTASALSPLEVSVRDPDVCASCQTLDCIRGTRHVDDEAIVLQRGCELALFQPEKKGNMDCTFCMDCVYACPHENVGVLTRLPGSELWNDDLRAGVGRPSRRPDLSALAAIFTFAALLNAFAMTSPVYALQEWLGGWLGVQSEWPVLGSLFLFGLAVEPAVLIGSAAYLTRRATGDQDSLVAVGLRFAYGLVPIGVGIWAAHYSFHLLTGFWTFLPVVNAFIAPVLAVAPMDPTTVPPGLPDAFVYPVEVGLLSLGLVGSWLASLQIATREYGARSRAGFVPWAVLAAALWAAGLWLLSQPMEMRGTFLGG